MKNLKTKTNRIFKRLSIVKKNPLAIMFGILALLIVLIVAGDYIRNGKIVEEEKVTQALDVSVYRIGTSPKVKVLGKVEKKNVIKVLAQTSGVVQKLYVKEGDHIANKGTTLAYISSNYQGGSALTVSRQLAQKQYQNTEDTFQAQLDLLNTQRELANKVDENSDELRGITQDSIQETKDLIQVNEDIIDYLNENITRYEATNSGDLNRDDIATAKQLKSSYGSALNSLKAALRTYNYQTDDDEAYAELSDLTKRQTLQQLDLNQKALELNREVSKLQYQLAQINESLAYPASFSNGDVEKVHVKLGQQVSPGTVLFTISGCDKAVTVTALVPKQVAKSVSLFEASTLTIGSQAFSLTPNFISSEATDGMSYTIEYVLPENIYGQLSDGEYVQIEVPVGTPDTTSIAPFIPIDAIYQSAEGAFVFVSENGVAMSKKLELGQVYGQFVEVNEGLQAEDLVILDRNVIEGDLVNERS